MISADDGSTIWTLPLKGFMSTQTYSVHGTHALIFHSDQHLWVNADSGKIVKQVSITDKVSVRAFAVADNKYVDRVETLPASKSRSIIQQSNLLVGDYHYFRSYTHPYIGSNQRRHWKPGVFTGARTTCQIGCAAGRQHGVE